jgi:hypothetical protein
MPKSPTVMTEIYHAFDYVPKTTNDEILPRRKRCINWEQTMPKNASGVRTWFPNHANSDHSKTGTCVKKPL